MKKRTKIIILSVMVLLLGVTGYLNVALNKSMTDNAQQTNTTTTNYFASYRTDRESSRDRMLAYYQAIVDSAASTAEEISNAKASMLDLASQIQKELYVEGLIKGVGFDDCVMTMTPTNINVVVKSTGLNETEVAQIVAILQEQLNASLENIKIMPIA
mgnify:CR=1 FL=1